MNSWYGLLYMLWWLASCFCFFCYSNKCRLERDRPLSFLKRVNALGTQGCRVWWHCFKAEWNARDQYTLEETQFFKSTCSLSQNITNESVKLKSFKSKTPHCLVICSPFNYFFVFRHIPFKTHTSFTFPLFSLLLLFQYAHDLSETTA